MKPELPGRWLVNVRSPRLSTWVSVVMLHFSLATCAGSLACGKIYIYVCVYICIYVIPIHVLGQSVEEARAGRTKNMLQQDVTSD
jgi:hypothetical protein